MPPSAAGRISLPQEIIDLIIEETWASITVTPSSEGSDELQEMESEDGRTLRTFLLVSRSFRQSTLPHIFRNVRLAIIDNRPTDRLQSLVEILESASGPAETTLDNPGRHIRNVFLTFETFSDTRPRDYMFEPKEILCQDSVINLLVSLRRHAHTIDLLSVYIEQGVILEWASLDSPFQKAFQDLVRVESLRLLHIVNLVWLPVTFLKGTHLILLTLLLGSRSTYYAEDPSMAFAPANPADVNLPDPSLQVLVTDHTCPFGAVPIISPPGSLFSSLKELKSIMRNPRTVLQTWDIISASPALEVLVFDLRGEIVSPPPGFDLGMLSNLRSLGFHHNRGQHISYVARNDRSLAEIINLLDTASPMEHFKDLGLDLILTEYNVRADFFHPTNTSNASQWEQLDILLTGPKYPALKTFSLSFFVHIIIQTWTPNEFDNQVFLSTTIQKLKDELPRLSSSDKILFDIKLQSDVTEQTRLFIGP